MEISKTIRWIVGVLAAAVTIPIALNWQEISIRLGWSTVIADAIVPKQGPSPVVNLISSPVFLIPALLLVGAALGMWVDLILRRFDARKWYLRHMSFSIRQFACLVADVPSSKFEHAPAAIAVADEIRGYVDSGHMPTFFEQKSFSALRLAAEGKDYPGHPYALKTVSVDAVILKSELEKLARARDWPLPWPIERKNK